ncbi:phospholipase effector Tle1 domain-containing protein [Marinobacter lacisalsi]|uniref:Phospholipase effector Tle1 domain-containing protein n=1 Tax=Marinobacter lacisalsi TaxID=475979 RepID=A0ABV8QCE2_9GAMM
MFLKDPIEIGAPLNRIYVFTRWYRGNDPFGRNHLAFIHDRAYATESLRRLVHYQGNDPFSYGLYDVWQLVYQKPWIRPGNIQELIRDLADKIHRGELFVYEERSTLVEAIAGAGSAPFAAPSVLEPEPKQQADQPRTQAVSSRPPAAQDKIVPSGFDAPPAVPGAQVPKTENLNPVGAEPPKPKVRVEAGVFFDGTGNNRGNIQSFQDKIDECLAAYETEKLSEDECNLIVSQHSGESYLGAETNVSKLEYLYLNETKSEGNQTTHSLSVYLPGVGTKTGDRDSGIGLGTGLGGQGLFAKTELGAERLTESLGELGEEKIDELVLDVFGFSRGAATARHFVNEVIAGGKETRVLIDDAFPVSRKVIVRPDGVLGKAFHDAGLPWPETVTIRFLGIFDTVAAIADVTSFDFSPANESNDPANIHISADAVQHVAHLTSEHERRKNFALNSLRGDSGNLPSHFGEWVLPGVHSDLGGGYRDRWLEDVIVRPPVMAFGPHAPERREIEQQLAAVEQEGWVGEYNLEGKFEIRSAPVPGNMGKQRLSLWLTREVRGEYSRIPLHVMRELAVRKGVPLRPITEDMESMLIPSELSEIATAIEAHVLEGETLALEDDKRALLKQRYIHHSDHYGAMGPMYPFEAAPGRKRVIYNNKEL